LPPEVTLNVSPALILEPEILVPEIVPPEMAEPLIAPVLPFKITLLLALYKLPSEVTFQLPIEPVPLTLRLPLIFILPDKSALVNLALPAASIDQGDVDPP